MISYPTLRAVPYRLFKLLSMFVFNTSPTTETYTLSLHDALPILCARRSAEALDQLHHVVRQRGLERHLVAAHRVRKRKAPGMERLPVERDRTELIGTVHVATLTNQRVAPQPRLQPDLISLPRHERDLEQRRVAE